MDTKTNYKALSERIRAATTIADLDRLDRSMTRIYDAGQLTPAELKRLDIKIIDKEIKLLGI